MKKLSVALGLAICLCGCSSSAEPTSETTQLVTELEGRTIETREFVVTTESISEEPTEFKVATTVATTESTEAVTEEPTTQPRTTQRQRVQPTEATELKTEVATEMMFEDLSDGENTSDADTSVVETEEITTEAEAPSACGYTLQYSAVYHVTDNHLTRSNGSIRFDGHRETWYSTNEGCGQNTAVSIPGKHVADDGTIRDADGYICVASSDYKFYRVLLTSVGPAKVYDCGCSHGTVDVYTNW